MDPTEFEQHGFSRDAESGLFYEVDAAGRIQRFGWRSIGEAGEGTGHEVEILPAPVDGIEGVERTWTTAVHPHPDGDPTIDLRAWALEARQRILVDASRTPICSFCSKTSGEVARLIAGPSSYICNECVSLCWEILDEGNPAP
jgi:hypothetical protein